MKSTEQLIREEKKRQSDLQKKLDTEEKNRIKEEGKEQAKNSEKSKDDLQLETDEKLIPQIEKNLEIYLRMQEPGQTFTPEHLQNALGIKTPIEKKAFDNVIQYSDAYTRDKSGQLGLQTSGSISSFKIAAAIVIIILVIFYIISQ